MKIERNNFGSPEILHRNFEFRRLRKRKEPRLRMSSERNFSGRVFSDVNKYEFR